MEGNRESADLTADCWRRGLDEGVARPAESLLARGHNDASISSTRPNGE